MTCETEPSWDSIFKLLRSPGIHSKESIPPACVAADWYYNSIPSRFLTAIDFTKILVMANK